MPHGYVRQPRDGSGRFSSVRGGSSTTAPATLGALAKSPRVYESNDEFTSTSTVGSGLPSKFRRAGDGLETDPVEAARSQADQMNRLKAWNGVSRDINLPNETKRKKVKRPPPSTLGGVRDY
jgi:uncharacterized protein (DUF2126 family)